MIQEAKRAGPASVRKRQRDSGVEANTRIPGDQRIVGKPGVLQRVGYVQHVIPQDRVRAKRHISMRFGGLEAVP